MCRPKVDDSSGLLFVAVGDAHDLEFGAHLEHSKVGPEKPVKI